MITRELALEIAARYDLTCQARLVLVVLWSHANDSDSAPIVWPGAAKIAACVGCSVRTAKQHLANLRAAGLVSRARRMPVTRGGRTSEKLVRVLVTPRAATGKTAIDGVSDGASEGERASTLGVSDGASEGERASTPQGERASTQNTPREVANQNAITNDKGGGDADRIYLGYEALRVRMLGGTARSGPAPESMHALAASLGGDAATWKRIEAYGRLAIELAADAVRLGLDVAPSLVMWRSDGGEWERRRFDAVMERAAALSPTPSARAVERDIEVDGCPLDRWEREAWDEGGEDAVRIVRSNRMEPTQLASLASELLAKMGAG